MNPTTIASVLLTAPDRERQAAANELKNRLDLRQTAHTGTRGRLDRVQSDHGVAVRQILVAMVSTAGFEPYSALYQPIDPMIPWMVTVAKVQLERARGLIVEDPQASAMAKHFEALPARPMRTSMDAIWTFSGGEFSHKPSLCRPMASRPKRFPCSASTA